jgi:hypothetical protein
MVSLPMLNTINQQCSKICSVGQDATAALPVVVFMGDFHQFAPISAQPLWQTPKIPRAVLGKAIWDRFTDVVTWTSLHAQQWKILLRRRLVRQHDDCAFQGLLRRAKSGMITAEDVDLLNKQVATSSPALRRHRLRLHHEVEQAPPPDEPLPDATLRRGPRPGRLRLPGRPHPHQRKTAEQISWKKLRHSDYDRVVSCKVSYYSHNFLILHKNDIFYIINHLVF